MKDLGIERRGDKNYYIAAGLGSLNLSPHLFFSFLFSFGSFLCLCQFSTLVLALLVSFVFLWFYGLFCFGFMVCFSLVFMVCFALVFFSSILRVSFGISTWGAGYCISTAYPRGGDEISPRRACSGPDEAGP